MNEQYFYSVIEDSLLLIEGGVDYAKVRLFKSPVHAKNYKDLLVEREELRPSRISIGTVTLAEIFELIPELTAMAEDFYEVPLKIIVTDLKEDVIIDENEIYDSNALLN